MMFNIRDYLNQLSNLEDKGTYYQAICPECHKPKLKINKSTGTFACYGRHCKFKDIVKHLDPQYKFEYIPKKQEYIEYLPVTSGTLTRIADIPNNLSDTLFVYSRQHQKIKFSKGEYCYQTLVTVEGTEVWKNAKFDLWNPYVPAEIPEASLLICVEGEKDVHTLVKLGYAAFTFPTINIKEVDYGITWLQSNYNFEGVLVLNDADTTGYEKQKKTVTRFHKHGIPCSPVSIEKLYSMQTGKLPSLGYDISDYVEHFKPTELCLI